MVLEVKKQERETSQSLVRRFAKRIQQSGILHKIRKGRFHARPKSKNAAKEAALRREELKEEYKRLKKIGKPEDDAKKRRH